MENQPVSYILNSDSIYLFVFANVGMGDITSNTVNYAFVVTGDHSGSTSKIFWIIHENEAIAPTINGLTFNLTMPSNQYIIASLSQL